MAKPCAGHQISVELSRVRNQSPIADMEVGFGDTT
jgi:hypothetical protein